MSYTKDYMERAISLNRYKVKIDKEVADLIDKKSNGVLVIDNIIYSASQSIVVYCYLNDYKQGKHTFYPVWDSGNCGDYGWSNFADCCRIYDAIRNRIEQ